MSTPVPPPPPPPPPPAAGAAPWATSLIPFLAGVAVVLAVVIAVALNPRADHPASTAATTTAASTGYGVATTTAAGTADGVATTPVTAIALSDNLTPNPSFEDGSDVPSGWSFAGESHTWSTAWSHTGGRSACFNDQWEHSSSDWYSDPIPVDPERDLRVELWVRSEMDPHPDRYAYLSVDVRGADGSTISPLLFPLGNDAEASPGVWQLHTESFTTPAGAASVRLGLGINNSGPQLPGEALCFDDVLLADQWM